MEKFVELPDRDDIMDIMDAIEAEIGATSYRWEAAVIPNSIPPRYILPLEMKDGGVLVVRIFLEEDVIA